jgi:putative endonuclease
MPRSYPLPQRDHRDERRLAERRGRRAETLAAWWLRLKFYRILARDYRLALGEVDLIARRGHVLAFVEVKRRSELADGLEAVSARQRRRVGRAALAYIGQNPKLSTLELRFDVVVVTPAGLPHHLEHAWSADSA